MSSVDLIFNLIGKDKTAPAFRSAGDSMARLGKTADAAGRSTARAGEDADRAGGRMRSAFAGVDAGLDRVGRAAMTAGAALGGIAVAGAVAGIVKATRAASDLGESINAVNVTFGDAAGGIQQLGQESAKALGMSRVEFNSLAVQFSNFAATVAGPGGDVAATMDELTTRASDFASVMNLDVAEAATLFQSGLAGETEPLRKYGIDLSAAAVEAYAMANGIGDGTGELTEQEKVLARYGILMESTAKTAGDFANTQGSMANQSKLLRSNLENFAATVGTAFTPLAEAVMPAMNDVLVDMTATLQQNMPAISEQMREFGTQAGAALTDLAARWPEIKAQVEGIAQAVRDNWPEIVETAKTFGVALERVGAMTKTLFDAFQTLPPELQAFIATVALLQKTGVLTIGFKAADIVKDLFASKVPVMNVGVLNAGVGGGGGGAPGGAAGKLGGGALAGASGASIATATAGIAIGGLFAVYHDELKKALDDGGSTVGRFGTSFYEAGEKAREADARVSQFGSTTSLAGEHMNRATQTTRTLASAVGAAGTAAGLTQAEIGLMTSAALAVPADASVDELANEIRLAGEAAGLSAQETDTLAAAAYAVPGSANLPALAAAITTAGAQGQWTTEQTNIMTQALFAIPEGANAAQAGEAIRIAGVKAGLTDEQIRGVTAAANSIPPNKGVNVTTNAPAATGQVNALQAAINSLAGKTVNVGVSLSGGTGGGGTGGSVYSGGAAGVSPWLDGQVSELAKALAPKMLAAGNIGSGPWVRPTSNYVVSSEWMRGGSAIHYGIDLAAPIGTPVHAVSAGTVSYAGWNNGYGNFVEIDHGGGATSYAHMSSILARVGQLVGPGTVIGTVGSTGDSTGPHLHFETLPGYRAVEPRAFMAGKGVSLRTGGMVPVNVSNGEWLVPASKASKHMPLLTAINAGQISGPGSGTSDSIRGVAAAGDFVVNARQSRRHRHLLRSITHGSGPSQYLAAGGLVGNGPVASSAAAAGPVEVRVFLDGRELHESLIRYRREAGAV